MYHCLVYAMYDISTKICILNLIVFQKRFPCGKYIFFFTFGKVIQKKMKQNIFLNYAILYVWNYRANALVFANLMYGSTIELVTSFR